MAKPKAAPKSTTQPGRDLTAFSDLHDRSTIIPRKIRDGLKSLGQRWMYAHEFAKHCGISKEQLSQYGADFGDHWTDLRTDRKRVWAGSAAFLQQLKARVQ